ncbi:hypothetical protein ACQKOM_21995 [Peribacillus frigoritolerans]|uniref:hypothetical protein n=1 Tax=Peribacillus frigoritolerans TaxID=450367 RepID=UPI003D05298F
MILEKNNGFKTLFGVEANTFSDILFGVSGGLLTLVGLIAIYISLNSQNKVDKAREILWDLGKLSTDGEYDWQSLKKLRWYRFHYSELVKSNLGNTIVITIAIVTISFVGCAWGYYIQYLNADIFHTVLGVFWIISISIMFLFIVLLLLFSKVSFIGGLPNCQKLFSLREDKNPLVKMGNLILLHCPINVGEYSDVPGKSYIHIPLPFNINLKKKIPKWKMKKTPPFISRPYLMINFNFSIKIFKGDTLAIGGADQILNELDSIITFTFTDRRHLFYTGDKLIEGTKVKHSYFNELYFTENDSKDYSLLNIIQNLETKEEKYTILGQLTVKDVYTNNEYHKSYGHLLYAIQNDLNTEEGLFPFRIAKWSSLGGTDLK